MAAVDVQERPPQHDGAAALLAPGPSEAEGAAPGAGPKGTDGCFFGNAAKYEPVNMPGQGRSREKSPEACQRRCADVRGCAHFSFWDDHGCHLQAAGARLVHERHGVVVGPPRWPARCKEAPLLVRNLFTFGAPAVAYPALTNPGGACVPGMRVYNENTLLPPGKQSDAAAMTTNFPHVKSPVLVLRGKGDSPSIFSDCPGETRWPVFGVLTFHDWIIHRLGLYQERLESVNVPGHSREELELDRMLNLTQFMGFTYDMTLDRIREDVRRVPEWNLVGYMDHLGFGSDVDWVILAQHSRTLSCVIAFQGSQGVADLASFLNSAGTGYCGFGNTHTGVRNELWRLTADLKWEVHLKPKLAKCAAVDCVGHSLGGSLCNLFTACANSGHLSDPDYRQLAWQPASRPEALPEA